MAYDPLSMDDPSHPLHAFAADFAQMRQRRQMHDQRRAMMVQQLAQAGSAPTMGGAGAAMNLPGAMPGQASPMAGMGGGLGGLADAIKSMRGGEYSAKIGGTATPESTGGLSGMFSANGGMKG